MYDKRWSMMKAMNIIDDKRKNQIFVIYKDIFKENIIEINSTDNVYWRKERVSKVFSKIHFGIAKRLIEHIRLDNICNIKKIMDKKGSLIIDFGMLPLIPEREMELFSRLWRSINNENFCIFIVTHVSRGSLKKTAYDYYIDDFECINKSINEWILNSW